MFNETSLIQSFIQQLQRFPTIQHLFVAVSGGVDSTVLLHLLAKHRDKLSTKLHAIHIHHGLNQAADSWQQHVERFCFKNKIPLEVVKVEIKAKGESIEAKAREARYEAFKKRIDKNSALLLAHHQDDQAETLLLQLFRGAGIKGLASMPQFCTFSKGFLFRPLLNYSRNEILAYAIAENLNWIDDDSNDNTRFDRNYLRKQIMPLLKARWPTIDKTLARSANLCAEANHLLQQRIKDSLQSCLKKEPFQLSISELKKFSEFEQSEILRAWFQQLNIAIPNKKHMQQISNLISAKQSANPLVCWKDVELTRYRNTLFLFVAKAKGRSAAPTSNSEKVSTHFVLCSPYKKIQLKNGQQLIGKEKLGGGIALNKISEQELSISFRNENGKRLKKIFQHYGIPPWQRSNIPLIFLKDKLIAVIDVWIHPAFKAKKDEVGIEFSIIATQGETI